MKLKIISMKAKPFKGTDGEQVEYYWYKALRSEDDVTIEFGTTRGEHEIGADVELNIERMERAGGKFGYREAL